MENFIIIGLGTGAVFGSIPCITAFTKGKFGLGLTSFFVTMMSGGIAGMLLCVPVCGLFMYKILKKETATS